MWTQFRFFKVIMTFKRKSQSRMGMRSSDERPNYESSYSSRPYDDVVLVGEMLSARNKEVKQVQDKEDTDTQIYEEAQEDILPHEEEDVKEEPQIEGELQIFLKEDIPEEVTVKEASDEEEAEGEMLSAGNMEVRQEGEQKKKRAKNSNDYTSMDLSFYSIKDEVFEAEEQEPS
ncbi:hypothetical protein Taro_006942 [Colocasia esculenta]|uniref:Uncharacterized protein n=1 Tax=Colocasia esculenta TaxID=4460 RepID=A0A843TSP0_COLES|nr:hypothetical protein [Colocasia esculenta]